MVFSQQDFFKRLEELYARNVAISRAKNADYAGVTDPFKNFRLSADVVPVEKGIFVRMSDKVARIGNLLTQEAQVKDESILDTLSDLANYAMILRMWLEQKGTLEKRPDGSVDYYSNP